MSIKKLFDQKRTAVGKALPQTDLETIGNEVESVEFIDHAIHMDAMERVKAAQHIKMVVQLSAHEKIRIDRGTIGTFFDKLDKAVGEILKDIEGKERPQKEPAPFAAQIPAKPKEEPRKPEEEPKKEKPKKPKEKPKEEKPKEKAKKPKEKAKKGKPKEKKKIKEEIEIIF